MAKVDLPPIRIDAVHAIVTALEVIVVLGTLKVIAYNTTGTHWPRLSSWSSERTDK